MTKLVAIQQIHAEHVRVNEFHKRVLDIMIQLTNNDDVTRYLTEFKTRLLHPDRSHKYRAICRITGRSRASTRRFGLTRITTRTYGQAGFLPGLHKAS